MDTAEKGALLAEDGGGWGVLLGGRVRSAREKGRGPGRSAQRNENHHLRGLWVLESLTQGLGIGKGLS